MVRHHLRSEAEWQAVFEGFHRWLKPGGTLLIADLVAHSIPAVRDLMWQRHGDHLTTFKGKTHCNHEFACTEQEDTPQSLTEQLDWLRQAGFESLDVLHKNSSFAAFAAVKSRGATA